MLIFQPTQDRLCRGNSLRCPLSKTKLITLNNPKKPTSSQTTTFSSVSSKFNSSSWRKPLTSSRWPTASRLTSATASSTSRLTSHWLRNSKTKSSRTSSSRPTRERKAVSCTIRCRRCPSISLRNRGDRPKNRHWHRVRNCSRTCLLMMTRMGTPWGCLTSAWWKERRATSTRHSHCAWYATLPRADMTSSSISGSNRLSRQGGHRIRTKRLLSILARIKTLWGKSHKRIRCQWWGRLCSWRTQTSSRMSLRKTYLDGLHSSIESYRSIA